MKQSIFSILFSVLLCAVMDNVKAQGCSDAGFCTINSFKPQQSDSSVGTRSQFKIGVSYGTADNSISVMGNYLEFTHQINDRFGFDARVTSLAQSGNNISAFGLSDLFLNANYAASEHVILTLGTKLPLANGNKKNDGLALPMDYQSSLGTVDLILGIGYRIKNLQLVAALQQPLTQNKNAFFADAYPAASALRAFQSTNMYTRSGDVLLRMSYPFKISNKFSITPSLLPIYHLSDDSYTDMSGTKRDIAGSQGLTLNGNIYVDYALSPRGSLQLNAGAPFVVRDARPDGLTRGFVANLEYTFRF